MEEDSTGAEAEDSTAAEGFMEVAAQRFTGVGVLAPESTLGSAADTPTADIVGAPMQGAAITEGGDITEFTAVTAGAVEATAGAGAMGGAAGIGAEDMVTDGAGDLALGGRIGVGDGAGDIHMAPTTAPGITRLALIILIRTMVLRTIPQAIRILATGTTILRRKIPAHGPCPTRTGRRNPGDHPYREAHRTRATQTRFSP